MNIRRNLAIGCAFAFSIARAEFFEIESLSEKWRSAAKKVAPSVVRFQAYGDGVCSGTQISNSGHVLSAQHCFEKCLRSSKAHRVHPIDDNPLLFFATTKDEIDGDCDIMYMKTSAEDPEGEVHTASAKIVAVGKGRPLLNPSDERIDSMLDFYTLAGQVVFRELLSVGVGPLISDYVIFKTDAFADKPCAETNKEMSGPDDDEILSLAYPTYTSRKAGLNPNGRKIYASFGAVSKNGVLGSTSPTVAKHLNDYSEDAVREVYNHSSVIWSDIDAIPGVSGSPTVNQRGEVHGVTVYSVCPSSRTQAPCTGSAASIKLSSIFQKTKNRYGMQLANEWFSCR